MQNLSREELVQLIGSAFPKFPGDRSLAVLVDLPANAEEDHELWRERRKTAQGWAASLREVKESLGYDEVKLVAYPNVGSNNADLPATVFVVDALPDTAAGLGKAGAAVPLEKILESTQIFLAPTEYSTTAPLKIAGKKHGFRAATMPGFSAAMLPALRLDYGEIGRRVNILCRKLTDAESAEVVLTVDGAKQCDCFFDLRFRNAHASSGCFPERGVAGNLPSGEAYIVPYEGEKGAESRTSGVIPVEFAGEVVYYRVERNLAVAVEGEGEAAKRERDLIAREPAYANIAELGFGVLADFGVEPIGEILLDEKLGFHIAFGRSDHFGGNVGPSRFSSPKAVVHIDRIYIAATQPRILVQSIVLTYPQGGRERLMKDGKYLVF